MNRIFYFILTVGLLYLVACNPQPEAALLLKQAENIVETDPDRALQLLDSRCKDGNTQPYYGREKQAIGL